MRETSTFSRGVADTVVRQAENRRAGDILMVTDCLTLPFLSPPPPYIDERRSDTLTQKAGTDPEITQG